MKRLKIFFIIFSLLINCASGAFAAAKQVLSAEIIFPDADNIGVSHAQTTFVYNAPFAAAGSVAAGDGKNITDIEATFLGRYNGETYAATTFTAMPITVENDNTFLVNNITLNTASANVFYYKIKVDYKADGAPFTYETGEYTVVNPNITLTPVTRVSANHMLLSVHGELTQIQVVGNNVSSIVFEYRTAEDPAEKTAPLAVSAYNKPNITFANTPPFEVPDNTTKIEYRIKAFVGAEAAGRFKTSPWYEAEVSASAEITDFHPSGTTSVALPTWHSQYDGSVVSIEHGAAVGAGDTITFEELAAGAFPAGTTGAVKVYKLNSTADLGAVSIASLRLSFAPEQISAYEIRVMNAQETSGWQPAASTVDNAKYTVSASNVPLTPVAPEESSRPAVRAGGAFDYYFGVFPLSSPSADKYQGPDRRIAISTRTSINFRNPEGSTVRIFNTNGKKVKEASTANFVWDGKNVPSGTYIYQVKIKGEIKSGTIAVAK